MNDHQKVAKKSLAAVRHLARRVVTAAGWVKRGMP